MKNMLRCPKCAGKKIWVIEKFRIPGDSAEGRPLPLVPHQDASGRAPPLFQQLRVSPRGHLDLHVCDGCGYAEWWCGGFQDLVPDPERGIRLVDTSDVATGPFR